MKIIFLGKYLVAIPALLIFLNTYAADVVVIAHQGTNINAIDVREIFTGEKQFSGNTKLVGVDNASAQDSFCSKMLGMNTVKYANLWTKKSFREGLRPPDVKSSDAEVIEFVKRTPGAIGYVFTTPTGVEIVK